MANGDDAAAGGWEYSAGYPTQKTMLFLHGMQSRYGKTSAKQMEAQAQKYAEKHGFKFEAIPISGDTPKAQQQAAQHRINQGGVGAVLGFSAGGYTASHLKLPKGTQRIIVGAPRAKGNIDTPGGHMDAVRNIPASTGWQQGPQSQRQQGQQGTLPQQAATRASQSDRPSHYGGTLTIDDPRFSGQKFSYGTGGRGRGSAPFGSYPVGQQGRSPRWGFQKFDIGGPGGTMYDPKIGATRSAMELHPGRGKSAGCISVDARKFPQLAAETSQLRKEWGHAYINLMPDGRATISKEPIFSQSGENLSPHAAEQRVNAESKQQDVVHLGTQPTAQTQGAANQAVSPAASQGARQVGPAASTPTMGQLIQQNRNNPALAPYAQMTSMIPDQHLPVDQWKQQHGDLYNNPMVPQPIKAAIDNAMPKPQQPANVAAAQQQAGVPLPQPRPAGAPAGAPSGQQPTQLPQINVQGQPQPPQPAPQPAQPAPQPQGAPDFAKGTSGYNAEYGIHPPYPQPAPVAAQQAPVAAQPAVLPPPRPGMPQSIGGEQIDPQQQQQIQGMGGGPMAGTGAMPQPAMQPPQPQPPPQPPVAPQPPGQPVQIRPDTMQLPTQTPGQDRPATPSATAVPQPPPVTPPPPMPGQPGLGAGTPFLGGGTAQTADWALPANRSAMPGNIQPGLSGGSPFPFSGGAGGMGDMGGGFSGGGGMGMGDMGGGGMGGGSGGGGMGGGGEGGGGMGGGGGGGGGGKVNMQAAMAMIPKPIQVQQQQLPQIQPIRPQAAMPPGGGGSDFSQMIMQFLQGQG